MAVNARGKPRLPVVLATLMLYVPLMLGGSQALAQSNPTQRIKIGVILPLTGAASDFGTAVRNGALWGAGESDASSGRGPVDWKVEDVALSTAAAVTAFHKLTTIDEVDAIFVWGAPLCSALGELAEKRRLPLLEQCILESSAREKSYVMRFMNGASDYMGATSVALKEMNLNSFVIVTSDASYDEELTDAFTRQSAILHREGRILRVERFASTEQEFRPVITRLKVHKPEAVLAFLGTGRLGIFLKQYREQRVSFPVFGGNSSESRSEREAAAGAFQGSYFINTHVDESFLKKYKERFKAENQMAFAAVAYEFGRMTKEVVTRCPDCRGMRFLDEYKKLSPWKGEAAGTGTLIDTPESGAYWRYPMVLKQVVADTGDASGKILELRTVSTN